jgi:VanZ family protein
MKFPCVTIHPVKIREKIICLVECWGPAFLVMAAIFGFSSLPSELVPDLGKLDLSVKKLGHALGYALLALAYARGIGPRPWASVLAWLLAVLFAASDEFHQSFVPGRTARVFDIGIDSAGAGLGLILQTLARIHRSHSTHPAPQSRYR